MKKYNVNEDCIACGMCAEIAPEVFKMEEDRAVAYADDGENAEQAMDICPVNAIYLE